MMSQRKRTWFWLMAAAAVFTLALAGVFACGDDDDDDDEDGDDDSFFPDDDTDLPDDDTDDDDTGDDDVTGDAPVLSNGFWDPNAVTWSADCETTACLAILFSVCDPDGDLTDPGGAWFYAAGTTDAFFVTQSIAWGDLNPDAMDVTNCDAPLETGVGLLMGEDLFGSGAGDYELAIDIEATDASGNVSNKLTNLTATVTYNG
ncbi:MAG: hypothetical protein M5R36_08740 [Deltaproteobacteria bacterium]|nr:hypothetical protein [Deltaproteobacteria bacterium]